MGEGRRRLERNLNNALSKKQDKPKLVPALLGAYVNGQKTIKVAGREDFVWCRIRGSTSEVVQAFNDIIGLHYDLPILIYRDPNYEGIWKVYGRDIESYQDWEGVSYVPPHGATHSFVGGVGSGNDPVWVYKRQFMPLLPRPQASGAMSIYIEQDLYYWEGEYHWWPGSGTPDLTSYKPTGSTSGKFVTAYIDGASKSLVLLEGDEFDLVYAPDNPTDYIPVPAGSVGIPLASVILQTGTTRLGWHEIYDLRLAPSILPSTGSVLGIYDEESFLGGVSAIDFTGAGVEAVVSGSYAFVQVAGGGGGSVGVYNTDDGVPVGTGTRIDWGNELDATISGTTVRVDVEAPVTGTVVALDEGLLLGSPAEFDFVGAGVETTISGARAQISIEGGGGGSGSSVILDEGVLLGSATAFDFVGAGVTATISGSWAQIEIGGGGGGSGSTYVRAGQAVALGPATGVYWRVPDAVFATGTLSVAVNGVWQTPVDDYVEQHPSSGTFAFSETPPTGSTISAIWGVPAAGGSSSPSTGTIVIYSEDSFVGVFEEMRLRGSLTVENSGSYASIEATGGGGGGSGSSVILDEGILLGSATEFDFVGAGVEATISGSRAQISIAGGGGSASAEPLSVSTGTFRVAEVIDEQILSSTTGSISIYNIPQDYDCLELEIQAKSDSAFFVTALKLQINGDTGNNYYYSLAPIRGSGLASSDGQTTYMDIAKVPGTSAPSDEWASAIVRLDNYSDTDKHKTITVRGGATQNASDVWTSIRFGSWTNNNAISQLDLSLTSPYIMSVGTRVRLVGYKEVGLVTDVQGNVVGPDIYQDGGIVASSPAELDLTGAVDVSVSGSRAQVDIGGMWSMRKSSSQTLSNSGFDEVTFDTTVADAGGSVIDLANNRFVAPTDGFYLAVVNWMWEATVPSDADVQVLVNGVNQPTLIRGNVGSGYNTREATVPLNLGEGDLVTLEIDTNTTGATARGNALPELSTHFTLVKVG